MCPQVPGTARSVLRIEPPSPSSSEGAYRLSMLGALGGPSVRSSMAKNRFKWLRGALCRDGCIYGIPSNADCVLRIVVPHPGAGEPRVEAVPDYNPALRTPAAHAALEEEYVFLR